MLKFGGKMNCMFTLPEDQFQEEFSDKEKARLYEAIGYHENEVDPTFPKEVSIKRETEKARL